jgi:glucokinase
VAADSGVPAPAPTSYAVGLDIGGTKISGGVVDGSGRILARSRRSTAADDPDAIERDVLEVVAELSAAFPVEAVGVAAAGLVDADRSTVRFAPNIAWRDRPLGARLSEALGLPVRVENDANAAGWAEHRFGAARGTTDVLMVTLGTGIGGAVITDSKLVRGANGFASEIGHLRFVPDGLPCGCGRLGCWEQYASGTALSRGARHAAATMPDRAVALLARTGGDPARVTGEHVTALAREGDELALELVGQLVADLGRGIASLVAVLDPGVVVLGGGMATDGDFLLPLVDKVVRAEVVGPMPPVLRVAHFRDEGGLVGAADLARSATAP